MAVSIPLGGTILIAHRTEIILGAFIVLVTEGLEAGKLAFKAAGKIASAAVGMHELPMLGFLQDESHSQNANRCIKRLQKARAILGIGEPHSQDDCGIWYRGGCSCSVFLGKISQ
jgi:hypothetical protein